MLHALNLHVQHFELQESLTKALLEHPSVTLFREYLRIKTVHPKPDYAGAATFFKRVAADRGLNYSSHECVEGKPFVQPFRPSLLPSFPLHVEFSPNLYSLILSSSVSLLAWDSSMLLVMLWMLLFPRSIVILTWQGSNASLSSILLNSHIDVVPVEEDKWTTDPFGAFKDVEGNIFARGAQDMKCVGIQHLEAVCRLKESGFVPKRTVHLSFVPDEEIGGKDGMEAFVKTSHFSALNVGFALDEGLANPGEECMTYYGERSAWWIVAEASGPTGHGSQLFKETAVNRLMNFLFPYHQWRQEESKRLHAEGSTLKLGDVTTVNINMIKSGAFAADGLSWQTNIIPSSAKAAIDMRIAPTVDLVKFESELMSRAKEHEIKISILQCMRTNPVTSTDSKTSPWWHTFQHVCQQMHVRPKLAIFPAATDSRFIRATGVPAIGFSPMNHTPVLLHDHNEYLNENTFLKGIDFFTELVRQLTLLDKHAMDK